MSKLLLRLTFLVAALAVACGGGGDGETDLADREITDEQLSLMVLPQPELGEEYASFELDEDESGFHSNEEAIDDAFDEEDQQDEARDIEQFGRVNGYEGQYMSMAAMMEGEGAALIGTQVDLLKDVDGASGYFRDGMEDANRQVGKTSEGVTAESLQEFDAGQIADEASGYVFHASVSGDQQKVTLQGTTVGFRRGRIIGSVVIMRLDDKDVREEAIALARKLDERIQAVLRGEVEAAPAARPVPTAEATPAPSVGVAPSEALDSFRYTAELAAQVGGSGFTMEIEGEFEGPDRLHCTVSGSLGGVALGRDELVVSGDDAWLDSGEGFEATTADDPNVVDDLELCPGSPVFWEDFDFIKDPSPLQGEPDTKNGVKSTLYAVGEAADALQSIGFLPSDLEGVTINTFDIWVAEDGGWPVGLDMDLTVDAAKAGEIFGVPTTGGAQQAQITMRVDITNVNDTSIRVEEPAQ